jgi:hypothetical protein
MFDPTVGVEGSRSSELRTTASNYAVQAYETRSARPQGPAYLVRYRVVLKERRTALLLSSYR